jgi:uncharacterized protein DUF1761
MSDVNLLAVLVAAIAAMVVGWLWYSQNMFGKQWMHAIGVNPHDEAAMAHLKKNAKSAMVSMFVGALVMAFVLAMFSSRMSAQTVGGGMEMAFWAWLGFAMPMKVGDIMFNNRNRKLLWIDGAYQLVNFLIMGAIVGGWK